ncbi:MAG TPA: chemotaxis protein CheD [Planctomycetota bacterium]|nr:chemotaxis protein CheD [Planctomycetota bacterium]
MSPDTIQDAGRVTVGIGVLEARRAERGLIITHALGSCLGIVVYDHQAKVGAMLHAQLPLGQLNAEMARLSPARFVDLGLPLLFQAAVDLGANRRLLRVTVAGAANMIATTNDLFNIATRNLTVMRKFFWQQGILLAGEDTGGTSPRTMSLRFETGETVIESQGRKYLL